VVRREHRSVTNPSSFSLTVRAAAPPAIVTWGRRNAGIHPSRWSSRRAAVGDRWDLAKTIVEALPTYCRVRSHRRTLTNAGHVGQVKMAWFLVRRRL